jgi:pyrimidine-nucleoside phosphorylase
MIPAEIIAQKRDGKPLDRNQMKTFVETFTTGQIPDAQMASMLMAIYFNGLSEDETFALVEVMIASGKTLDFSQTNTPVVDKHSTGGIGDKTSLVIAPLLASAGLTLPMIAGRSLGHTGGTIDKLEAIPGFQAEVPLDQFKSWVDKIGCAIIGQTGEICTADKKMYALRDITATVPSIPLICASIMSKKIAEGIDALVLDVKTGSGAFMKTREQAETLGRWMKKIGNAFHVNTDIVFTSMNQPLGNFSGVWCEVEESIQCLKGQGSKDTMEVVFALCSKLMIQSKKSENESEAIAQLTALIASGNAYEKFVEMVNIQGGDTSVFEGNPCPPSDELIYLAKKEGVIQSMNTEQIGWGMVEMGCGRKNADDKIDFSAGVEFYHKVGAKVEKGMPIARLFNSNKNGIEKALVQFEKAIQIGNSAIEDPLILGSI